MHFSSIRWRLATTYVFVTVVVVGMVGFVALALIKQQTQRQEQAYLRANASVVAQQAAVILQMPAFPNQLQALAETAAFLSNSRVQLLGVNHELLADSGVAGQINDFVVMAPSAALLEAAPFAAADWMLVPGTTSAASPSSGELAHESSAAWPAAHMGGVAQRDASLWGESIQLHFADEPQGQPASMTIMAISSQPAIKRSTLLVEAPIGDPAHPSGYVAVSEAPNVGGAAVATSYRAFGIAAACAVALALLISLLVSRRITAPLAALTAAAQHMSGGDLAIRAPVAGRDEVGRLAAQFNVMAAQLHASFAELAAERDTLRRFVADASHELRTPITALKTFNELLQSYTDHDPAARAEFLAESQLQLERLESIVHHLLDLSRLDARLVPLERRPYPSAELAGLVLRRFQPIACERGLRLELNCPEPAPVVAGDHMWLELALANLVDNALKFSPAGTAVELGVRADGAAVRLWVADCGSGIAPADQPHIFERFYRGQGVRQPGSGLGLAIVASVVQAHGGSIALESPPGGGSRFTITLAAADQRTDIMQLARAER